MISFGTPESIGETNKKLILNRLRTQGNMSRADLSRSIGMSFTAVASNVKYLLDHDYIREVGAGDNSHGRKSTLLSFNATRGYVVGVDIGRTKIRCMVADLLGNQIASATASSKAGSGNRVITSVSAVIEEAASQCEIGEKPIFCICIGIPGVVRGGNIYLAPNFANLSIAELRRRLGERYGAEVLIENGVNLGAIGELRYGRGARYADMVYISYGVGLGAALVLQGRLYSGFNNAAGEIGFMQTRADSRRAAFHDIGELETAVSPATVTGKQSGRNAARDMAQLIADYDNGVPAAKKALDSIAADLGMALVNICAVANPQAVILSGGMGKTLGEAFLPNWRDHMSRHLPFPPELILSDLDERETMLGAVGTAVDYAETIPIIST
ncbi:MAG: ROK family protein [Planctomycetes bacterium]|nr:ROK family protein [Planctomycetota bacterium]